jgi:hypothetical protein
MTTDQARTERIFVGILLLCLIYICWHRGRENFTQGAKKESWIDKVTDFFTGGKSKIKRDLVGKLVDYFNSNWKEMAGNIGIQPWDQTKMALDLDDIINNSEGKGRGLACDLKGNQVLFDVYVDALPLPQILMTALGAVGLSLADLNVLPAASSCSGCTGSSPVRFFSSGVHIKSISGVENMSIVQHSVQTLTNEIKIGIGSTKGTTIRISLGGSFSIKHQCHKCLGGFFRNEKTWRELISCSGIDIDVSIPAGKTMFEATGKIALGSKNPLVLESLRIVNQPIISFSNMNCNRGDAEHSILVKIAKLVGFSEPGFAASIVNQMNFNNFTAAVVEKTNTKIGDEINTECSKVPRWMANHIPYCTSM